MAQMINQSIEVHLIPQKKKKKKKKPWVFPWKRLEFLYLHNYVTK
jgi:hypothetical protein